MQTRLRYKIQYVMSQQKRDTALSRALSKVLRHQAPQLKLNMSSDGYVPVDAILSLRDRNLNTYLEQDVSRVVETNEKQRFKLTEKKVVYKNDKKPLSYRFVENDSETDEDAVEVLCIRANQGHSIPNIRCEELLTEIPPEELKDLTIIHGTNAEAWKQHISKQGLSRMKRNHIHFASGLPGEYGVISGMRKNCEIYIYVDGALCSKDAITFYKSDNGVILSSGIDGVLPLRYIQRVVYAKSKKILYRNDNDDETLTTKKAKTEENLCSQDAS